MSSVKGSEKKPVQDVVVVKDKAVRPTALPPRDAGADQAASLPRELTDDKPFRRLGLFVTFGMLGVFVLWAALAPLKSAVVAPGKIIVETRNKVVQHLDGGLVAEIHVKEGDLVKKGQLLLELSDIQIRAQLDIVNSRLWEAIAHLERLTAERNGQETLVLSDRARALQNEPKMAEYLLTQDKLFQVRRQAFHSEQSMLRQRVGQIQQQIQGLEQLIVSEQKRARSLATDVKDWQSLYERQFADKVRLREMERQLTELQGIIAGKQSEIARLRQVAAETEHQVLLRQQEYLKEVSDRISEAQSRQTETEAQSKALSDQLRRVAITAPDDGRVVGFNVVTVGAVIEARRPIMEIVPAGQAFAVMGKMQTQNIDQVFAGQRAEIKFTAFHTSFLPVLYGHVSSVSADALQDQASGMLYYEVKVVPEPEAIELLANQGWELVSGMPADVYIQAGERTLLNYIIRPLRLMISRAFNEENGL